MVRGVYVQWQTGGTRALVPGAVPSGWSRYRLRRRVPGAGRRSGRDGVRAGGGRCGAFACPSSRRWLTGRGGWRSSMARCGSRRVPDASTTITGYRDRVGGELGSGGGAGGRRPAATLRSGDGRLDRDLHHRAAGRAPAAAVRQHPFTGRSLWLVLCSLGGFGALLSVSWNVT